MLFFPIYVSAQFHASESPKYTFFNIDQIHGIAIKSVHYYKLYPDGRILCCCMDRFYSGNFNDLTLIILPLAGFIELKNQNISITQMLESAAKVFNNNNSSFFMGHSSYLAFLTILSGLLGFGIFRPTSFNNKVYVNQKY